MFSEKSAVNPGVKLWMSGNTASEIKYEESADFPSGFGVKDPYLISDRMSLCRWAYWPFRQTWNLQWLNKIDLEYMSMWFTSQNNRMEFHETWWMDPVHFGADPDQGTDQGIIFPFFNSVINFPENNYWILI